MAAHDWIDRGKLREERLGAVSHPPVPSENSGVATQRAIPLGCLVRSFRAKRMFRYDCCCGVLPNILLGCGVRSKSPWHGLVEDRELET